MKLIFFIFIIFFICFLSSIILLNLSIKSFFNFIRLFLPFSICKYVNSFISSTYSRPFFIFLHPFLGKIDLISKIIDLNGDSLYAFLTFFLNILNNSSFFYAFLTFTPLISAIIIKSLFDNFFGLEKFRPYIM